MLRGGAACGRIGGIGWRTRVLNVRLMAVAAAVASKVVWAILVLVLPKFDVSSSADGNNARFATYLPGRPPLLVLLILSITTAASRAIHHPTRAANGIDGNWTSPTDSTLIRYRALCDILVCAAARLAAVEERLHRRRAFPLSSRCCERSECGVHDPLPCHEQRATRERRSVRRDLT